MSTAVISALDRYANADRAIRQHIRENDAVFKEHEKLVAAQIDARAALEDIAVEAANPDGVSVFDNGEFKVTVTPRTSTVIDPDELRAVRGRIMTDDLVAFLIKTHKRPPTINVTSAPSARV